MRVPKKTGTTELYILDERGQSGQTEEKIKSLCNYILNTAMLDSDRKIRISKTINRHELEWHRIHLTEDGMAVEIVF